MVHHERSAGVGSRSVREAAQTVKPALRRGRPDLRAAASVAVFRLTARLSRPGFPADVRAQVVEVPGHRPAVPIGARKPTEPPPSYGKASKSEQTRVRRSCYTPRSLETEEASRSGQSGSGDRPITPHWRPVTPQSRRWE